MAGHQFDCSLQHRVMQVEPLARARLLRLFGRSKAGVDEPLADLARKGCTMFAGDQGTHHVHRRHAAGAGIAVTVNHIERALDQQIGGSVGQRVDMRPVNGKAPPLHQPGLGKDRRSAGYPAEPHRPLDQPAQRPDQRRVLIKHRIAARRICNK